MNYGNSIGRMRKIIFAVSAIACIIVLLILFSGNNDEKYTHALDGRFSMKVQLPPPKFEGNVSVEKAIKQRRSVRAYLPAALTLHEISQLLWAAQGITNEEKLRAAPSAGALYPIALYVVVEKAESLREGIYRYFPEKHEIVRVKEGKFLQQLADAALGQHYIAECSVALVIAANYDRLRYRYRERSERYAHIEVGHVSQNVYLQAEALGIGTVNIGAFYDNEVAKVVGLELNEHPLCIMPLGKKKK
ncbi:MAG: SagB/ThcOx family dehydrogenase [Spirochaetes bacterium]|nr:SagB/ThcOx family dehydrogenase [Spirochaetota bacterium]